MGVGRQTLITLYLCIVKFMSILSNPRKDMGYPTAYPIPTGTLPFYGTAKSRWYIHGINPWDGISVEYRILGVAALIQTNN